MAVISFKCPNCDGELIFDPATGQYKCEYCDSLFTQQQLDAMKPAASAEKTAQAAEDAQSAWTGARDVPPGDRQEGTGGHREGQAVIYTCPSCGAEIITDETTAATFCYYCHNPVVLGNRLEGKYLPNRVIPFQVTKEVAEKGFLTYVGKKKFVPKAFFDKRQITSMTGVYFPYWLYDVELDGKMQADARTIRVWRTKDVEYTETKHYAVCREGDIALGNLPENALQKANAKLALGVMPYDFSKAKEFHMGYLSGFVAERRDIEQTTVQAKMQSQMRESAEKLLRETISGYNGVSVRNVNFLPKKELWSYVLLPVWTITYKGRDGKVYYYSMNAQTGKVCGELPVDGRKLAFVSLLTGLVVFAAGLIGGYFLW